MLPEITKLFKCYFECFIMKSFLFFNLHLFALLNLLELKKKSSYKIDFFYLLHKEGIKKFSTQSRTPLKNSVWFGKWLGFQHFFISKCYHLL